VSVLYEQMRNRFPLRGIHLRILVEGLNPDQSREAGIGSATRGRAIRDLVQWAVLRPDSNHRGRYIIDEWDLLQGIQDARLDRSDLFEILESPRALPLLAALPLTGSPVTLESTGLSRPTIRAYLNQFHRVNLIQRLDGDSAVNQNLTGVARLVNGYRNLQARWNEGWSKASASHGSSTHLAIHQRGVETAWRLRNADVSGNLHVVDWNQPFFSPLAPVHNIAYHGPRELTLLDEALLLVRAEADLDYRVAMTSDGVQQQDVRIMGLVAAGFTERSLARLNVIATFDHYNLIELHESLSEHFRRGSGGVMMFRDRYLNEFGVEEGCLV
jgi:hypothetical protein